jgi:hypothetical protein
MGSDGIVGRSPNDDDVRKHTSEIHEGEILPERDNRKEIVRKKHHEGEPARETSQVMTKMKHGREADREKLLETKGAISTERQPGASVPKRMEQCEVPGTGKGYPQARAIPTEKPKIYVSSGNPRHQFSRDERTM